MESEVMREYLLKNGILAKDILIETQSLDTVGNIYYSSKVLEGIENVENIIIITSSYHISRVSWLVKKIMPEYSVKVIWSDVENHNDYHEEKVINLYEQLFNTCKNKEEIFALLCKYLPWYSDNPKRTKEDILNFL